MPVKSISELRSELVTKERQLARLRSRRAKAARLLDTLDRRIGSLTGEAPKRRRKKVKKRKKVGRRAKVKKAARKKLRHRRATGKPLAAYIREALGKTKNGLSVTNTVKAVTAAGYRSHSKDFYAIVAKTLLQNPSFRRVKRGVYKVAGQ